jgi:DNA processing protein
VTLSLFWHAAALHSGRIDLSPLLAAGLDADGIAAASPARMAALGVEARHLALLRGGTPLVDGGPHLCLGSPAYPADLAAQPYAPPVLFYQGDPALLQAPRVAVVGSRQCTELGRRMASRLAQELAGAGLVVVSGLAHGIDAAAHGGSLARTIAVVGQGLGVPFASHQQRLIDAILVAGGLILSELLPSHPATRYTFPARNRIIAGLGAATVVVEARRQSGALITARQALELGRELMAVPGHPLMENSEGCLDLLAHGARLVRGSADVMEAIGHVPAVAEVADDPLLALLREESAFDSLSLALGLDARSLAAQLASLELLGQIERLPGDRFRLRGDRCARPPRRPAQSPAP